MPASRGRPIYASVCSQRKYLDEIVVWIYHPQPPMPTLYPSELTAHEVVDIASYEQSL